jgi:hypothetical protein
MAESKQTLAHLLIDLPSATIAHSHLAKIWMTKRQVNA